MHSGMAGAAAAAIAPYVSYWTIPCRVYFRLVVAFHVLGFVIALIWGTRNRPSTKGVAEAGALTQA